MLVLKMALIQPGNTISKI